MQLGGLKPYKNNKMKIDIEELEKKAVEIRELIISTISTNGGHLASNLGVVELTLAIHTYFNTPDDILVWDVGHQCYAHKIITDRREKFHTIRKKGGLSGFTKRSESPFDPFGAGHAGTAISAVLGFALSSKLKGENRQHIAVVGDAAFASGIALEGLSNALSLDVNALIIINDNGMSIDKTVGQISSFLQPPKADFFFSSMGISFIGQVDGHNFKELFSAFDTAGKTKGIKVLIVKTIKGKGYAPAEKNPTYFHSPQPFNPQSGKPNKTPSKGNTYQDIVGKTLLELSCFNDKIIAVTPAMTQGSSLVFMREKYPERVIDVGICEQHAVTFSAGLAASGMKPFCVIYSTFLQRAYDSVIHDVILQNLPVVFCIDRAGYPTSDGQTHMGMFDIAFLNCLPNIKILTPSTGQELRQMLFMVQQDSWTDPVAIRYPKAGDEREENWRRPFKEFNLTDIKQIRKGKNTAFISVGFAVGNVEKYIEENALNASHYCVIMVKPLPRENLDKILEKYSHIVVTEEGVSQGGFSSALSQYACQRGWSGTIENMSVE